MDINYALFDDEYTKLWDRGIRVIQVNKVFDRIDFEKVDKAFSHPFYKAFLIRLRMQSTWAMECSLVVLLSVNFHMFTCQQVLN